jgi:tRNA dimethylallyltransferase
VHLISADSRQVYRGLEILTGADVPEEFIQKKTDLFTYPYFQNGQILLHGIGVVSPTEDWSVANFQELALPIIDAAQKADEVVILVGGTGLYHDHLFSNDPILRIAPNSDIRSEAANRSISELQEWLERINPDKFSKLNQSDRNNARRLIRAIEVASTPVRQDFQILVPEDFHHIYFGISAPIELVSEKISERVRHRFEAASKEVSQILSRQTESDQSGESVQITKPARTSLGFAQLAAYLTDQLNREQTIELWALRETQYAKRQLTWWKKRQEINWIDIQQNNWQNQLVEKVEKLLAAKPEIN